MKAFKWIIFIVAVAGTVFVVMRHDKKAAVQQTTTEEGTQVQMAEAKRDIRDQVIAFGAVLKNVSLLAPTAGQDIEREYSPYITHSLLASWAAHPDTAAGRLTSSPWPDHIDVVEITAVPDGTYHARAMLVFMTSTEAGSGGDAGSSTLDLVLIQEEGAWKIDEYTVVRQNNPNASRDASDRPQLE